jgi:hypothetical protein
MRAPLMFAFLLAIALAVDVIAFDGRYSGEVWRDTKYQFSKLSHQARRWLDRANF